MEQMLPAQTKLKVGNLALPLTKKRLEGVEHVLVLLPRAGRALPWNTIPAADALKRLERRRRAPDAVPSASTSLDNKARTGVTLCRVDPKNPTFAQREMARRAMASVLGSNPSSVALLIAGFDADATLALSRHFYAAALAATAALPTHKRRPPKPLRLRKFYLCGDDLPDLASEHAAHTGNHLARWLTALPTNDLDAASYRKRIAALAKQYGWQMQFLSTADLTKKGAGAFLAVARAGDENAGIAHLSRRPGGKTATPDLALVGKGVCFDTGGVNVKPANYMQNMHDDMQGSAVALGVLAALTELDSPLSVDCWLAITENLIGRKAYKPNEVVTALNGTTIEIMHTDAEGRMILADTLSMAAAAGPKAIIDYATLTGACVNALTTRYSGVFTNRAALNPVLVEAGVASGERVWPFPMDGDYDRDLQSPVADIRQCRLQGGGDHILAARFLGRFCGKLPWIHVDLASGRRKGGLGHVPSDVTGFGVGLTLNLLDEQRLLDRCG